MGADTVWLVGMMGAGKSSLGPRLADRLGRGFRDADHEIEARAHARVAEIFEREGEAAFRRRERAVIEELAGAPLVVALGGGAVAQPGVRARLRETGTSVYLRARPETLAARVGASPERPLLAGLDAEGRRRRLAELLAERAAHYETAELTVDVDEGSVDEIVERVARALEERG